jgi:hypothetical protein
MADDKKPQPYPSYILPGYSDTYEGPTFGDLLPKVESIEDLNDFSYMPSEFIDEQKKLAAEKRRQEVSKSRMMQSRLGDPELTPSQLIKIMQAKKLKDAKDEKALTAKEIYRMKSQVEGAKTAEDRRKKMIKENQEAAKEAEKFVPRDTVLGRIFDKRVKPDEEISNRDKAFAYIRNISDNLLERRLVGGKEGTDTLSRILGPGGGIDEGRAEVEALEDEAIALREKGETKKAAAIETLLKNQKTAYEIKKIDSEAMKNIAEAMKSNYSKATQQAMELATIRGFEPGTAAHMDETAAILSVAVTEGQAAIEGQITDLQNQLLTMDEDSDQAKALTARIDELRRKSIGTTVPSYAYDLPPADIDEFGKTKQS